MSITAATFLFLQVLSPPSAGTDDDFSADLQARAAKINKPEVGPTEPEPPSYTSPWLKTCLSLVESAPARAHVRAQLRVQSQEGQERVLALHCLGLAATQLERWDEAQTAFISARDEAPASDNRFRARLGTMAAGAAVGKGDIPAAMDLLNLAQMDAEAASAKDLQAIVAIEQSRALVAQGRLAEAEPYLVAAQQLRPNDVEAPLLAATLLRRLDRLDEAQAQIEEAIAIAPFDPAIGLEAGVIAVLDGRDDAAKASWQSVIRTSPGTDFANTANGYLAQLDPIESRQEEPIP